MWLIGVMPLIPFFIAVFKYKDKGERTKYNKRDKKEQPGDILGISNPAA
jgi:hypothetical protein